MKKALILILIFTVLRTYSQEIALLKYGGGGDWYAKIDKTNLFQVRKPNTQLGIGIDALPSFIRNSEILSGNNLGQLGNVHVKPETDPDFKNEKCNQIHNSAAPEEKILNLHSLAKTLLEKNKVDEAWQILLSSDT